MAYITGSGTTLSVKIGGSGSLVAIPQVKNITPPAFDMGEVETTHLTSTAKEFMPTLADNGEVDFDLEFDPANTVHQDLLASYQDRVLSDWEIALTDTGDTTISFTAFIKHFGVGQLSPETVVMIPGKLRVVGAVTVATDD